MSLLSTTIGSKYALSAKTASASPERTAAIVSSGVANSSKVAPLDAMYDAWIVLDCAATTAPDKSPEKPDNVA